MKIKVACIGAGYFAGFHLEAWQRLEHVELVAICDHDVKKAQELADEYTVSNVYRTLSDLLEKEVVDVIDIITPPSTHLELCRKSAQAGKHIICQKPLAPTINEAQEIVDVVEQCNVRFMVHENFRFQPWYRKIKEILDSGILGDRLHTINHRMRTGDGWGEDAYLARQPYFQKMERLLVYETGIHFIDVFRYLGGSITSVFAKLRKLNPVIRGEDAGLMIFDFENGCEGILDMNRYNEPYYENPRYTFGELKIEGNLGSLELYSNGSIKIKTLGKPIETISYIHEEKGFAGDCVYATQEHFVKCLKSGEEFETNGKDYLINLMLQEALYKSSSEKKSVSVPKVIY